MFCRILCADICGIDAHKVYVEADISGGLPDFNIVGLPSSEIREAKERVIRAITNSGIEFPSRRITINLSPASLKKIGSGFDLPIAIAILCAIGQIPQSAIKDTLIIGELSLDGKINPIRGILPITIMAQKEHVKTIILPKENAYEGAVIKDVNIVPVSNLEDAIKMLKGEAFPISEHDDLENILEKAYKECALDYIDVKGQEGAKRATMVAICGFHNLLYIGPPGSGKSMLSQRIPTILNRLSVEECLEVSKIYSVAGLLDGKSLILNRPFRSPHHSISDAALVGGSSNPKPGEITLANKGVLFLDEVAEFKKSTIEMLRQPLEDKHILISRTNAQVDFPCDFMLVMAMNPCKCGYYPDRNFCKCTEVDVNKYFGKIRGPILDRVDITIGTKRLDTDDFSSSKFGLSSTDMRSLIQNAQEIQKERFNGLKISFNSQMGQNEIKKYCVLDSANQEILNTAYEKFNMSARGYYKILKVARTIADLSESKDILKPHLLEAISYRNQFIDR